MQNIIVFVNGQGLSKAVYRGYAVPDDWSKYLIDEFVDFLEKGTILQLSWMYGPKVFQVVTNTVINNFRINENSNDIHYTSFVDESKSPDKKS